MKLYLGQHGEANPENIDPARGLTGKGIADTKKVADFSKNIKVDEIWHSTKLRAKQTAEIFAKVLGKKAIEQEGLRPNDPVSPIVKKIDRDLMVVGHLPFMEKISSFLITGSEDNRPVIFRQAGIVCLENTNSKWGLSWMVTPEVL
ncbi:MAG: phosphohistidine phosphatase SixA [Candidatus Margulisiibacteriota bacterium]|nr:phosphohistidine phosphatase SixA [Candidatus Margulisiibacteriota bacterium]